jgi:uncharacterized protein (TIGR04552 family)
MSDVSRGPEHLRRLDEFTLADLEALRLILNGDSVIDWRRLDVDDERGALEFLRAQELDPDHHDDRARMDHVKSESIAYLRRQFDYPIPRPVERATVPELLVLASGRGHRAMCACTILKCMHIIHHLDGRELLFVLPMSDQEVFHIVEEKVYRVIGGMLAGGFPIIEFVGGRKNKDSLVTKLLSKQETIAAQIFDKLRFRVVTRTRDDILPVLQYLTRRLFPFNYVVPGESVNSVLALRGYLRQSPAGPLADRMQPRAEDDGDDRREGDNQFSADSYRIIHFVVDMPVRLPRRFMERSPPGSRSLGDIIFVICEFQIVDRDTEAHNEIGDASHAKYKERQKRAVIRRLSLGGADGRVQPPRSPARRVPEEGATPDVRKRR